MAKNNPPKKPNKKSRGTKVSSDTPMFKTREAALEFRKENPGRNVGVYGDGYHLIISPNGTTYSIPVQGSKSYSVGGLVKKNYVNPVTIVDNRKKK